MTFSEALDLIKTINKPTGYMVSFEKRERSSLISGYFPNKHANEPLIQDVEDAWRIAALFAKVDPSTYVNVCVIGDDFVPVKGYEKRKLNHFPPTK